MKSILENWRKHLLTEDRNQAQERKEAVIKKYPWITIPPWEGYYKYPGDAEDPSALEYFIEEDPTGNNTYLMWMVDQFAKEVHDIMAIDHPLGPENIEYPEAITDVFRGEHGRVSAWQLVKIVEEFHDLRPHLKHKDLYSYKSYAELEAVL
jgi:hypothetical protein